MVSLPRKPDRLGGNRSVPRERPRAEDQDLDVVALLHVAGEGGATAENFVVRMGGHDQDLHNSASGDRLPDIITSLLRGPTFSNRSKAFIPGTNPAYT